MAADMPTLDQIRDNVKESLRTLRQDHKRSLNPTPYKVTGKYMNSNENIFTQIFFLCHQIFLLCHQIFSGCKVGVSDELYHFIHDLWLENAPIGELS